MFYDFWLSIRYTKIRKNNFLKSWVTFWRRRVNPSICWRHPVRRTRWRSAARTVTTREKTLFEQVVSTRLTITRTSSKASIIIINHSNNKSTLVHGQPMLPLTTSQPRCHLNQQVLVSIQDLAKSGRAYGAASRAWIRTRCQCHKMSFLCRFHSPKSEKGLVSCNIFPCILII